MTQRGTKRPFPGCKKDSSKRKRRRDMIDKIYKRITPDEDDMRDSKSLVDEILKDMLEKIQKQKGGFIYKKYYVGAGSHPVNAKIGKANEFDVNIPMAIKPVNVRQDGSIPYKFCERCQHLRLLEIVDDNIHIPPGYCVVEVAKVTKSSSQGKKIPDKFKHIFEDTLLNRSRTRFCIDLLPSDVKSDLHGKMSKAKIKNVSLSPKPHGPALTMTIKPQGDIEHSISLDVTASIEYKMELSQFGWPRSETYEAFGRPLVKDTVAKGTHLVPKQELFWAISFSRMERVLLSGMDTRDHGCRKMVFKMLKKYVDECKKSTRGGLPGISSHIIKTRVLWSCEDHAHERGYWRQANRDICLMTTMAELEETLSCCCLHDYFNENIDLLDGKKRTVLSKLARFLRSKRRELK